MTMPDETAGPDPEEDRPVADPPEPDEVTMDPEAPEADALEQSQGLSTDPDR